MAQLVIMLAARARAHGSVPAPVADMDELAWLLSPDGMAVARQGLSTPAQMPAADSVVAVVPATEVAWHRITCPKAPTSRMQAALAGLLEEQLLDDGEQTHLALAPGAAAGHACWVAAVNRPWLSEQLARLQAAGRAVDRVVPSMAPGGSPIAHFFASSVADPGDHGAAPAWLALADADQAMCLPLAGSHAPSLLARWRETGASIGATPATAALAERLLGHPVQIRPEADWALTAVRGKWQLLQHDLAPGSRGTRALAQAWQHFKGPAWRPVRWGLGVLAVLQLIGLNAYAWQQQRALSQQREAMTSLLRSTHPQVRAVLDAPVQMRRETELLRESAGVPGDSDFETLLGASATAWPDGLGPAAQIQFEPGRLSLSATGWGAPQIEQFRQRLKPGGWAVQQADGRLSVQRAAAAPKR